MAGEVALEQPGGLAATLAFGGPFGDVVLGSWVVLTSVQDDGVQGTVELPVAAPAESVPSRPAAGGGDRGDAGEASESGLGAQPAAMRPGDGPLRGLLRRFGARGFAGRAVSRARWLLPCSSGAGGYSVRAAFRSGACAAH